MRSTVIVVALLFPAVSTVIGAGRQIELGPTADFALNQPFVSFRMSDQGQNLGPSPANQRFLLDTAATSVVAVSSAAADLHRSGGNFNTGVFQEIGIDGFVDYFVSDPYSMHITGHRATDQITVDNVKILSDPAQDFGLATFVGIAGQPVVVNRVTTLDVVPSEGGGNIFDPASLSSAQLNVHFADEPPASLGHRYSIPVTAVHFDPAGDPTPDASPLAVVEVTHRVGCEMTTGNYAFDTGAQLSIMTWTKLAELGLEPSDATKFVEVQGAGGTIQVPLFDLDEFRIKTNEGIDLVYREADKSTGLQVIGLDLPQIDGVIGADFITQDAIDPNDLLGSIERLLAGVDNPIDAVHLDFRKLQQSDQSGAGTIFFDVKPEFDVVTESDRIHPADANVDGTVDDLDRQIWQAHNGQSGTRCSTGDFNRDGQTDDADLVVWNAAVNGTSPCDFDNDGVCRVVDLDALLAALGTDDPQFDLDPDSSGITLSDRDAWLTIAGQNEIGSPFVLGDLNLDGTVDPIDLNSMAQHWTQTVGLSYADGDIDGDQFVGPIDLNGLGQNWLRSSVVGNAPVPEPSPCYLSSVVLAAVCLIYRHGRRDNGRSRQREIATRT